MSKVEKRIDLNVQVAGQNKIKDLQKSIVDTMKAIEQLELKKDKHSKTILAQQQTKLNLLKIELSYERNLETQIDRNTAKYRKQAEELVKAIRLENRQVAERQANTKFWMQAPGIRDIWGQYKPTIVLSRRLFGLQERSQMARESRQAASMRISQIGGELAGWRTRLKNADAGSVEEAEAKNAISILTKERGKLYTGRKMAGAEEATANKMAGKTAATITALNYAAKFGSMMWTGMTETFRAVTGMSFSIKGNFKSILEDVSKITDMYHGMATYATGTSLISNAAARQTQLQYGLTGGQAYAFDKARDMLGIRSDEDLLYMNQSQKAVFMQYMRRQEQLYAKLESSGTLERIQRMQLDFSMYKQEMAAELMGFVADNKDTIIWVMKSSIVILKGILQAIFKILSFFRISYSGSEYGMTSSMLSDTVAAGSSTSVTNKNINMTAHLNANGVLSSQEALQEYMRDALATEYRKAWEASRG